MYKDLKELFNFKISTLNGKNFQNFKDGLFKLYYGDNYIPIRQHQDQGNDGCLKDKSRIFADYAPETSKKFSEVKEKFEEDHKKYKENWGKYKNFTFIYNNPEINTIDTSANELQLANEYDAYFWTRGYLIDNIIGKLSFSKIREVAVKLLGIDVYQYRFSILKWVIHDLTTKENDKNNKITYKLAINLDEKIKKNFDSADAEVIKTQIFDYQKDFSKLREICSNDNISTKLKDKIISSYLKTNNTLSFKERINILERNLSNESNDDDYLYYIRCIIFYIFEQCLIGAK